MRNIYPRVLLQILSSRLANKKCLTLFMGRGQPQHACTGIHVHTHLYHVLFFFVLTAATHLCCTHPPYVVVPNPHPPSSVSLPKPPSQGYAGLHTPLALRG